MSIADLPFKVGHMVDGEIQAFRHDLGFEEESSADEPFLVFGSPDPMSLLPMLIAELEPPLAVTVVLHTPRAEEQAGRYRAVLDNGEVTELLSRFRGLLERDARLDLCVESASGVRVTYDKHDLLLLGGSLKPWRTLLEAIGVEERAIELPYPHTHHYRQEFDLDVKALLESHPWDRLPLLPGDGD